MALGCLGSLLLISLVIWAFQFNLYVGIIAIIAGFALLAYKHTLKISGAVLLLVFMIWSFTVHWILGIVSIVISGIFFFREAFKALDEFVKKSNMEKLKKQESFGNCHAFSGEYYKMVIVDEAEDRFAFFDGGDDYEVYPISDLVDVHMHTEDDYSLSSSTGVSTTGAMVGGAIGGGLGALAGGVRKKHRVVHEIDRLAIRLIMKGRPNIVIEFVDTTVSKNSFTFQKASEQAEGLYTTLTERMH
ncbi:hypothetical protein [Thalassobacillus hwangdonensis]|uniref:Uncharacterized protein n=1 Tax=Thalassobacillus hwangdonensis TaxID=546108 RepID=A0ABW3L4K8_9BACI